MTKTNTYYRTLYLSIETRSTIHPAFVGLPGPGDIKIIGFSSEVLSNKTSGYKLFLNTST